MNRITYTIHKLPTDKIHALSPHKYTDIYRGTNAYPYTHGHTHTPHEAVEMAKQKWWKPWGQAVGQLIGGLTPFPWFHSHRLQ